MAITKSHEKCIQSRLVAQLLVRVELARPDAVVVGARVPRPMSAVDRVVPRRLGVEWHGEQAGEVDSIRGLSDGGSELAE